MGSSSASEAGEGLKSFEVLEGLFAGVAGIERFARGGAEETLEGCLRRVTARTGDGLIVDVFKRVVSRASAAVGFWRGDPIGLEPSPREIAHPVGGPGRSVNDGDRDTLITNFMNFGLNGVLHRFKGRASRVCRGHGDVNVRRPIVITVNPDVTNNAKLNNTDDRDFWVHHGRQGLKNLGSGVPIGQLSYHFTPGWARATLCISASRCPRCSLW